MRKENTKKNYIIIYVYFVDKYLKS